MIANLLSGNFDVYDLINFLFRIPVVLIALSFHEMAHAYAADKLGDSTARWNGRLTMNPASHFDLLGGMMMLFFGIGWAKPVPINPRNFKNPKKGMALTGLAGPLSNLILGFIGVLLLKLNNLAFRFIPITVATGRLYTILAGLFITFASINVYLAVFNMIPVPPFDGSRIFYNFLPDRLYFSVMKYEKIIMVVIILLVFTGRLDYPLALISGAIISLFEFIIGLVPFL